MQSIPADAADATLDDPLTSMISPPLLPTLGL